MMLWGIRLRVKLVTAAMLLTALPVVFAQQERFRERQVLDPNTDQWVEYEPQGPEEGVAGDTVDQARGHLADGRPGKARAVLRKWTKNNPDDERY